jgi:VIT1/CCC1 family predicted Fe2+/Mn2+ transporter
VHRQQELHRSGRVGWLRAAVLGAQDGIVSTAALLLGVAAADVSRSTLLLTGIASLAAGAGSMAAGEYGSVSSQRDSERADIEKEKHELARFPHHELEELTQIYEGRGLDRPLATEVAQRLMESDPLGSHMRDELGIHEHTMARPVQAAVVSAISFAVGAGLAVGAAAVAPFSSRIAIIATTTMILLAILGWAGARLGGAPPLRATLRITILGGLAMAITAVIGNLAGTSV